MNKLKTIGKWIVYGFAIFGATVFILGGLSVVCTKDEPARREPLRPKLVRVEFAAPRLNWQAADQALTERLDNWNEGLQFKNDTPPVWQTTTPVPEHRLSPTREPVWQPLPQQVHCY